MAETTLTFKDLMFERRTVRIILMDNGTAAITTFSDDVAGQQVRSPEVLLTKDDASALAAAFASHQARAKELSTIHDQEAEDDD